MTSNGWAPLLEGTAADRAREVVSEIALALRAGHTDDGDAVLGAQLALFFGELGHGGHGPDAALALSLIERAMDVAGEGFGPGLAGGFTGVACAVSLLTGRTLAAPESEDLDPCSAVDEALLDVLDAETFVPGAPFDLLYGLTGLGVYAIERLHRPAGRRLLGSVIAHLDEIAVKHADGKAWESPPLPAEKAAAEGMIDLGVAHGLGGVIGMLGAACARGVEEARPLLGDAVSFLLAQERLVDGVCFSAAPTGMIMRSAWCYGDPGIAAALLVAARGAAEPAWEAAARRVARIAAARAPEDTWVQDACLCHGAAGLGHVYNRLFQATGDEALRDAALFWMDRTFAMRDEGAGIAGYRPAPAKGFEDVFGEHAALLRGATGIGLALMAATAAEEPVWDRLLLLR